MIFPLGTMRKAPPPIKAEVGRPHMTNSMERGLVAQAFRCGRCGVHPFECMDFVTSYHVDRTNWRLSVPKDTHELKGAVGATPRTWIPRHLVSAPRGEAAEDLPDTLANCGQGVVLVTTGHQPVLCGLDDVGVGGAEGDP